MACGIYYILWAYAIPKWKGYTLRQELVSLGDGSQSNQLKKVPNAEVAEWDATHDAAGRAIETPAEEIQVQDKGATASSDTSYRATKGPNTTESTTYV